MPELGPKTNFSQEINEARKQQMQMRPNWEEVANKYNKKVLGSGGECWVVEGDDDKVLAISRYFKTPEEAKKIFYSHKILQTLFPYNFPHMYASFAPKEDDLSHLPSTIREKIIGTSGEKQNLLKRLKKDLMSVSVIRNIFSKKYNLKNKKGHSFSSVTNVAYKFSPFIFFDPAEFNFIVDDNNNEYYVDTAFFKYIDEQLVNNILNYMKMNKYSDNDINTVLTAFNRLKEL
ncbi:MAG: hypothetical protein WCS86_03185 [Candidatus Paceibacterota bacterium]